MVFRIVGRKKADFTKIEEQRPALLEKLKNMKGSRVVQDWMKSVEDAAEIKKFALEPDTES